MKKTTLIITALSLLVVAILMISGFKGGITGGAVTCNTPYILVGNDCCLDSNDNKICDKDETEPDAEPVEPPREEIIEEPVIGAPQELPQGQFIIKLGESVQFDGKTVELVHIDKYVGSTPVFIFNIGREEKEVYNTKNTRLINGIKVTAIEDLNLENAVIVKLEKFELNPNEYLMDTRNDITIQGKTLHLVDVKDNGEIVLRVSGQDIESFTFDLNEGEIQTFEGLEITNMDAFPSGFKSERQSIIKVQ